jgi:hypothetical protein
MEWWQLNAGWIALPLAVVLSGIGWLLGVRPLSKRKARLQQRQKGGNGSINLQVGNIDQGGNMEDRGKNPKEHVD